MEKALLMVFLLLPILTVFAEEKNFLKCFECSESNSINDNLKKCSVNQTRYTEAIEDSDNVRCRIWALNGVAVHKTMTSKDKCDNATLKQNVDNDIVGKFPGDSPAQAYCCTWNYCNFNTSFAQLAEEPKSGTSSDLNNLSISLNAMVSFVFSMQFLWCLL